MAMTFSAVAAPQAAKKLGAAGATRPIETKASVAAAASASRVHLLPKRSADALGTPSLKKAMTRAKLNRKEQHKAAYEAAGLPDLCGIVTFQDDWTQQYAPAGLYSIKSDGTTEMLVDGVEGNAGVVVDGLYYATDYQSFWGMVFVTISVYDLESGEKLTSYSGDVDNIPAGGATVDPATGSVYAITYNAEGSGLQLAKMEYTETAVTTTAIAPVDGNWNTLACDAAGQLYGISYEGVSQGEDYVVTSSALNKIDKATGTVTLIGDTGEIPQYLSSGTIDPKSGKMYWNVCPPDNSAYICEVNLATGAATKILDLVKNDEIMGMFVKLPAAEAGAPAAVSDLAADFPEGSLSGTVSFTMPATLFDGSAATGTATYEVLANGEKVAEGSAAYGAAVTAPATVAEAGEYDIIVTAANAAGKSPKAKLSLYIGNGTPVSPAVTLTYADGKMKLAWDAVTTTVEGGYIDAAAVTYTVTRLNDGTVVAEGLSATSFEEAVAMPEEITQYSYSVVAHAGELVSAPAVSNTVTLGSIVPPYANDFSTSGCLSGFTILDINGDGKIWSYMPGADGMNKVPGAARISYNTSLDMDDWMIMPPLKLEAGKAYRVSFCARNEDATYPERIEAKWGNAATVAAMTNTLVATTDVTGNKEWMELGGYIVPETDGIYYVGIHGISDKNMYYLYVDDLKVAEGTSATAPGAPTDIVLTADASGALSVEASFKAPALTMGGQPLGSLTKVEVLQGGTLMKTFTAPAVGETLTCMLGAAASGNVTYTFVGYNDAGKGVPAEASVYVGFSEPSAPENVTIVETANPGEVTLSWDAVTTDVDGKTYPDGYVKYLIAEYGSYGWEPITDEFSETSYTLQAVPAGQQDFAQYAVFVGTPEGEAGAPSDMIAVGTPYDGLEEGFANAAIDGYIWGTSSAGGGKWGLYDDSKLGIADADGNNGYVGMQAQYLEQYGDFFSGKVDLSNAVNAGVSFYTYNIIGEGGTPDVNEIQVYAKEVGAAEYTAVGSPITPDGLAPGEEGWHQATVSLQQFQGKVVQVMFRATCKGYAYVMLDAIKIGSMLGNDLAAVAVEAPAKVKAGADYEVNVKVANKGTLDATAFTVKLYADGEKVAEKEIESLASGKTHSETFALTMHALAEEPVELHAEVEYSADENQANNKTAAVAVAPQVSKLPAVTDLHGEADQNGDAHLTWSEPDLSAAPADGEVVDFEDGESFAFEYGDWTFIDADGKPMGGFQNTDIPGITPGETTGSFFIFEQDGVTFNQTFAAHSGSKYLASLFNYNPEEGLVDDWAISPMLDGSAQTITFYARSYSSDYPDSFDFLYSTAGKATSDFQLVGSKKNISSEWTEYSFDVPAGALYFAIRNHDTDAFMLMLDDFTFASAGASAELTINGYDVYRDGVKITAEPTGETEFTDTDAADGTHSYVVVAVYDKGISKGSNAVTVTTTGIADINADSADAVYYNMQGIRVLNPEKGGLYIRKQGTNASKVMVK